MGIQLSAVPEYMDDGFWGGGHIEDIWKLFQEELRFADKYGLRYDLGQYRLYLLVGDDFHGDINLFQDLGIHIDAIYDI